MAAIERRQRAIHLRDAIAMRMAAADGKGWKPYIKRLQQGEP